MNPEPATQKRLRIILVSNKCPPDYDGGLEMSAFQVANHLRARGHEVDFVTSLPRSTFKGELNDPPWVHRIFHYVEYEGTRKGLLAKLRMKWSFLRRTTIAGTNLPRLKDFLKGKQYDAAYCFGLHRIGLATATALTDAGLPILWHVGDVFLVDQKYRWPKQSVQNKLMLEGIARKWHNLEKAVDTDNIAFISTHLKQHFLDNGITPKRAFLIPRGIDFELADEVEEPVEGPATLFIACRVHPTKGIHIALEALAILKKKRPDLPCELVVAGRQVDDDYMKELQTFINKEGLQKKVRFLGQLSRDLTLDQMRIATAFLSTSIYEEPFGRTNIEALACGAPLISSRVGAIEEIIGDTECALLYEREDAAGLAAQLERVLESPELRASLKRKGLERIREQYTIQAIMESTEAAFAEVISG